MSWWKPLQIKIPHPYGVEDEAAVLAVLPKTEYETIKSMYTDNDAVALRAIYEY